MLHSQLKRPTISTLFQRPSEGVGKCDFRITAGGGGKKMMAIQTNERSNGSNKHPLKSAILICRASRSEVRYLRVREKVPVSLGLSLGLSSHWDFVESLAIHFRVHMSSPLLPPNDLTQVESSPKRSLRQRHDSDRHDSTGRKIIYSYSFEFLSKYVEWRKSRFEALPSPSTRKCYSGWYQALSNDNIWHFWLEQWRVKLCSRGARWLIYMIMSKQRQPVHRSDPPREVRLTCTARAALAFKPDILFLVN
jgi:hypothetical protein